MFGRLLHAMGRPELADRYRTMADRLGARTELDTLVGNWVGSWSADEVLRRLEEAEVPSSLVYSISDLFLDPQIQARENILTLANPLGGLLHAAGIVPKLSLTPGHVAQAGPMTVGEHNEEIYCRQLGLSRDDLTALSARGVI
jgi:formyl-CoA transferase